MKITCPACSAEYNVDPSRIPATGLNMRCPKCSQSFRVTSDGQTESADKVGAGTMLDGGGQAIKEERFYVKRPNGKVFGPFDRNAVQMMLKSTKLGGDAEVSNDKKSWRSILSEPAFSQFIKEKPLPSMENLENPKATMMGGWPHRAESSAAEVSRPAAKQSADLPAAKQSADLPAAKQSADLPAAKRGAPPDLPAPKRNGASADLPRAKGAPPELPVPKASSGGPGLPTPKRGAAPDLPTPKSSGSGAGLPIPKGTDLPRPRGADLPGAKDLPSAKESADLPMSVEDHKEGLPVPKPSFEEDLFGGGAADSSDGLFGDPLGGDDDDLFGDPLGGDDDDLFGSPTGGSARKDDDDLFGSPEPSAPVDDDLFGSPDDDLFGSPNEPRADDDLFGAPSEGDDLFGGGGSKDSTDGAGGEDFLGGDAGFSFLDDEPRPEPVDDWGDDLFGDSIGSEASVGNESSAGLDAWSDSLLEDRKPRPKPNPEPLLDADDPFRPASRGPSEPEPQPEAVEPGTEKPAADRQRSNVLTIALPILAVLVLGGAGYFAYTTFAGEETTSSEKTTKTVGQKDFDVNLLKSDNYSDYASFSDTMAQPKAGEEGLWLLAHSMMLARYPDEETVERATPVAQKLADAKEGWEALGRGAWEARAGNPDAARAYVEGLAGTEGDIGFFANLVMGIGDVKAVASEVERSGGLERSAPGGNAPTVPGDQAAVGGTNGADVVDPEPEPEPQPEQNVAEPASYAPLVSRARRAFEAAENINPDSALPHYWKGRLSRVVGDEKKALQELTRAVELGPTHVASAVELGELNYDLGNLNAAIETLEQVSGELSTNASNSEKARALHYAGLVHVARRQSDLAIESFTKALSVDPSRSDTLRALAEEYERAQKYKEALNFFTTNKNLGQKEPEVMLGIVRSHIGLEQWNQAIITLEEGQKTFPDDAQFPYYLGQLFMKRGQFVDARKPLQRAVEIDPSLLTAHATLAQLAWRMDKDMDAGEEHVSRIIAHPGDINADVATQVAEYYELSGRQQTAEDWYREALSRDPNHWPARLALAMLLLEENREEEAKELLERARQEGVQDVRLSAYLADAYRQAKDYDRAIDEINKVIEAFPKNERYIFIRGRIHFDRGNYDTAQADFQKAYDLNPRAYDAYFYVGRTAYESGDFANALKIFRHVLDYKPNRGEYRYFMARTLEAENRSTQALEEYRKATAVDPAYGIENPMVYVYRGRLLSKLNYSKEGKADIARALELAPDSVEALLAMGESEYYDKAYEASIEHYRNALQIEPARPQAQYRLGMAYLYTDRRQEAAQRLQLAIKHGYSNSEVYKRLGYLYRDLGQRSQAIAAFKKFLELAQNEGDVPTATKREILDQINVLQ